MESTPPIKSLTLACIREIIMGEYLTGDHMNTFHDIMSLHTDFRPQNVFYIGVLTFVSPVAGSHIQIISGNPTSLEQITHWICTYYDGQFIHIYDSLNMRRLLPEQQEFLDRLFLHKPPVKFEMVQRQPNMVDCGVFAIAFATSLVNHRDPTAEVYVHSDMRSHLLKIFDV